MSNNNSGPEYRASGVENSNSNSGPEYYVSGVENNGRRRRGRINNNNNFNQNTNINRRRRNARLRELPPGPFQGGAKNKSKRKIHKGPKGGKYYIKNGRKIYVKK